MGENTSISWTEGLIYPHDYPVSWRKPMRVPGRSWPQRRASLSKNSEEGLPPDRSGAAIAVYSNGLVLILSRTAAVMMASLQDVGPVHVHTRIRGMSQSHLLNTMVRYPLQHEKATSCKHVVG